MVTTFRKPGLAAWQGRGSAGGFRVPCRYTARRQPGTTREHQIGQVDSPHGGDRKRVVRGKSVSVRVDLGGRRIMKQKMMYSIWNGVACLLRDNDDEGYSDAKS